MMSALNSETWVTAALLLTAPATLGAIAWAGLLKREALATGPLRRVGLEAIDLAVAMVLPALALVGGVMAAFQDRATGPEGAAPAAGWPMLQNLLLSQAITQMPFVLWLLVRAGRADDGWQRIGLVSRRPGRDAMAGGLGLVVAVVLVMAINGVCILLQLAMGGEAPRIAHPLLRIMATGPPPLLLMGLILSALVLAPVLEEIIFRGLLQTALLEFLGWRHRWPAVICAAAAFAAVHVSLVPWFVMPGLFVLGVVLGWLYERTGSLWPCFVVHAGFNSFNTLVAMMMTTAA